MGNDLGLQPPFGELGEQILGRGGVLAAVVGQILHADPGRAGVDAANLELASRQIQVPLAVVEVVQGDR